MLAIPPHQNVKVQGIDPPLLRYVRVSCFGTADWTTIFAPHRTAPHRVSMSQFFFLLRVRPIRTEIYLPRFELLTFYPRRLRIYQLDSRVMGGLLHIFGFQPPLLAVLFFHSCITEFGYYKHLTAP